MTMTLDTLHPDIKRDLRTTGRKAVAVIDPSPGIWGGDPIPGLVRIVYRCPDGRGCPGTIRGDVHTHHALYGPPLRAVCGRTHVGCDHELVPIPGAEGMELYAD